MKVVVMKFEKFEIKFSNLDIKVLKGDYRSFQGGMLENQDLE